MATEAQRRAKAKWDKANVTQKVVKFYPGFAAELAHLEKQGNQNAYVVGLIADDMAREQGIPEFRVLDDAHLTVANGEATLEYGYFGTDTYGLQTVVDGEEAVICIHATDLRDAMRDARRLLARLGTGWRPVNW